MVNIRQIANPVLAEFERFRDDFSNIINSETPLLKDTIKQVLLSKGKHVRPILLLLTAKACGEINKNSEDSAVIVEILHTATLIHDDVVDDTKQRRGIPSLNAIFDNRIAVLTGDFILASCLLKAAKTNNLTIVEIIAQACRELAEGELIQLDNAQKKTFCEEEYLRVIKKKTATLISACCEIGAISVNSSSETRLKCRQFGKYLGYCFQIKDDIFDYFEDASIGKPTGNDIREGKITLPLIYALKNADPKGISFYMNIIDKQDYTPSNVSKLISFAKENGGIEYANKCLLSFKNKAVDIINSFPESEARNSLIQLADYFSERVY
jgi:octaprenyl-diphosphate synthase